LSTLTMDIDTLFYNKTTGHDDIIGLTYKYNITIRELIVTYLNNIINDTIDRTIIDFMECILKMDRIEEEIITKYFTLFFINYKLKQ
jgi:hypothetical protein